ncbi:MAG: hypothetical protein KIS78_10895 [Labilithrix sp.]|nr:hypothetical protein [Labilithrix sp.]
MRRRDSIALAMAGVCVLAACATASGDGGRPEFDDDGGAGASSSSGGPDTPTDDGGAGGDPGVTPDASTDAPIDVAPGGNPVGFPCAKADDCMSGECRPVLAGGTSSVCVAPCAAQADCADNFFCDPTTPGATAGFCVPRSPAHCKTCNNDDECGSLSERCGVADGDVVKACHVDCTIAGQAACPPDYTCVDTTLDGTGAKVCRPSGGLSCLDALGGFCDRVATPQACARSNAAGSCVGQRTCLAASTRYDACGAQAPVCKATCSSTDPAGCTTSYCAEATAGPANCGTCGTVCPGYLQPNANVGCNQPVCTFSCQGEKYNVDNDKSDGCEVSDPYVGNHDTNNATNLGDHGCSDSDILTMPSTASLPARLPSDSEVHANPSIVGFDSATGSAADYYKVRGTGSILCVNNIDYTLTMTGSAYPSCYHLHIATDKDSYDCDTNASGTCRINPSGSSKYSDNSTITFIVSKRDVAGCKAAQRDNPSYRVSGHF